MTTVAWDGKTVAADKQSTNNGLKQKVSKIFSLPSGATIAVTGEYARGMILMKWFEDGADPAKWPEFQKDDDKWTRLVVFRGAESPLVFEQEPVGIIFDEPFQAWGSGRDYALGAMAAGKSAKEAVEIATRFDTSTGCGVDSYELVMGSP